MILLYLCTLIKISLVIFLLQVIFSIYLYFILFVWFLIKGDNINKIKKTDIFGDKFFSYKNIFFLLIKVFIFNINKLGSNNEK